MKRTMKQVMLDKMTTHYLYKQGISVRTAKHVDEDELNLPHVMRQHLKVMDDNTTELSIAREISHMNTDSTATHSQYVIYTPEQEAQVEIEQIQEIVQEYIPETAAEEIVESPVVTESKVAETPEVLMAPTPAVEAPAEEEVQPSTVYVEADLRRFLESVDPSISYTMLVKRVKTAMDKDFTYDEELLVALAKEYAAAEKAKK